MSMGVGSQTNNMSEKIRESQNYGGLTLTALDRQTLEEFTFFAHPMRLNKDGESLTLLVEVWGSVESFENDEPSLDRFRVPFLLNYDEQKETFAEVFTAIESEFFNWLEVDAAKFDIKTFDVDLTALKIKAKAVNKTNPGKVNTGETTSLEEFEQIKADHPQLVMRYFQFAWTYAKTHDARLARFS
jgi:hypothetical protein